MKKIFQILCVLALVMLVSCKGDSMQQEQKGDFKVELLFEHEGCKMYRFRDDRTVYWCNCEGRVQSDYTTSSGKTHATHYEETITTKQ